MTRNHENRILKLEAGSSRKRLSHEDWVEQMERDPRTPEERERVWIMMLAEITEEYGSLEAAAVALQAKADDTKDDFDRLCANLVYAMATEPAA